MKFKIFLILCISLLVLVPISAESSKKLSLELEQKMSPLQDKDSVDVIIVLKEPKSKFSTAEEKSQSFKLSQDEVISSENISPKIKRRYSLVNSFSASLTKNEIETLEKNPEVESIYYPKSFSVALQDSVPQINADDVWVKQINSINITGLNEAICILDTGIDYTKSEFSSRIVAQHCYESLAPYCPDGSTEDTNASDDQGHGTHVAGIAAASGGINGVAKGANIVSVKIMNKTGSGVEQDMISGLEFCINNASLYNISAISMSLGGNYYSNYCDNESSTVTNLINQAISRNITVVIASGNNGQSSSVSWPACIENATAVAAVNKSDSFYSTGNRWNKTNILVAPGVSINSTVPTGSCTDCSSSGYLQLTGTSMATPHVAGAVALLQQYSKQKNNRQLTATEIKNALKTTGVNVTDSATNFSRMDVLAAVSSIHFYRIIDSTFEKNQVDTGEYLLINFTNLNLSANLSVEKIANKNLWTIISNLTADSFNATAKFYYNVSLAQGFLSNESLFRIKWQNSTSSGQLSAEINSTEHSAKVQIDHFTDFSLTSLVVVNGTNIAPIATNCNQSIGLLSLNISNRAQDDNITQIKIVSKNSNDSDISSVFLCSDDGNSNFNLAIDCNSTLKINQTNFSNSNATFSNIISVVNNTNKILYIIYNISSCQNNDIFDVLIPNSGITMQIAGSSIGTIDPAGNSTADFSAPYYTLVNVSNYSYSTNYLFYSTWLDNSQVQAAWVEINQSNNFTASSQGNNIFMANVTSLSVGNYTFRWWANDSVGNINQTSWYSFTIQDITFILYKLSPSNNAYSNNRTQIFSINATAVSLKNATLYIYSSGSPLHTNSTNLTGNFARVNWTYTFSSDGNYTWNAFVCDNSSNCNWSDEGNWSLVIDTTFPTLTLSLSSSSVTVNDDVNIQCTATDSNINEIKIRIESITKNTSSSSPCTYRYPSPSTGNKNISCTAEDEAGNSNTTSSILTVTAASSTQNTGSPGGGPATQPTPIPYVPIIESKNITVIAAGTSLSLPINKATTLSNIEIFAKNTISDSEIAIEKITSRPSDIPNPPNQVYSYIQITTSISDSDISNAKITFELTKSWLQNADKNSVMMYRYRDGWQPLSTEFINESENSFVFSAVSPGFSLFAITAKKMEFSIMGTCGDGACSGNETRINCCKDCGCEGNQTCDNNRCISEIEKKASMVFWFLGAVFLVILIRVLIFVLPKLKEKFKHKKFHHFKKR